MAIICWNTLRADTWYVNNETLDGEVNLANSSKSLLEINFEEYTHENSTEVGGLKEVEATVTSTPARNTTIGERQVIIELPTFINEKDEDESINFGFKTKGDYKKSQLEEKTYMSEGKLVAYVPEEVYEDIDSLKGKTVTVIFGDENEVALVVVESDVVDADLLTRYNDNEITVGGEKYELADLDKLTVIVNDNDAITGEDDPLAYALEVILGEMTTKSFSKKVEAELTLDDDEEVKKIELFVSGDYPEFNTNEVVVKKVRDERITTTAGKIEWDADKYEDEDYPRVYIDNVKAEITDIEAGDVLTIIGEVENEADIDAKELNVIYASRNTVEGEVSRIKNDVEIYIDGEAYLPSAITGALELNGEIDELENTLVKDFSDVHGETAVLYMNVLGEYVVVDADTVDSDWQFAVVDRIYDVEEDEENDDIFTQQLRLVMMDGSKVRTFKLVYDHEDEDEYKASYTHPDKLADGEAILKAVNKGDIIAFKANADSEIDLDDVMEVADSETGVKDAVEGYKYVVVPTTLAKNDKIDFDAKRFQIGGTRYKVTSSTTLLNTTTTDNEVITWKELVDEDNKVVGTETLLIVEENDTEIKHVIALGEIDGVGSSVEYALVLDATYTSSKTKKEVKLLGVDGEEYVYEYDGEALVEGTLISYRVSGNELTDVTKVVDLAVAAEADVETEIYPKENGFAKGAYLVETVDSDYFTYTDEEADYDLLDEKIIDVNLDDVVVVVYELADSDDEVGTFTVADFDEATIKDEYVLAFDTEASEDAKDYELLIVIK